MANSLESYFSPAARAAAVNQSTLAPAAYSTNTAAKSASVGTKTAAPASPVRKVTTTTQSKPVTTKQVTAAPVAPAAPTPKVTYNQLQNRGGTIWNKVTNTGYSNPQELANDLATQNIDYSKIAAPSSYGDFQNRDNTIVNVNTGQVFKNPTELAMELGIPADQIDWTKIPKQDLPGTGNNKYQVNQGLQGQLITNMANKASVPTDLYNQATQGLVYKSQTASPEYTSAMTNAQKYNQEMEDIAKQEAQATYNIEGSPIDKTLVSGQEGLLARLIAAKQAAAASAYQGATNLLSAANTQQQLQQQGLTSAAGLSTAQQAAEIGGLGTAAGLAAPIQVSYSNQLVNPVTGQAFSTGNSTVDQAVAIVANKVKNGTMTYADAAASVSGYGQAGSNALNQALSGTDIVAANANAAAAAQNITTGGTAATTASNAVYQAATQKLAEVQGMAANIQDFGSQLISNMKSANINPYDSKHMDMTINELANEFNSEGYAAYAANIQGLQARVSALLGTGELPSSASSAAQQIINGNMTVGAMQSAINQINNEAAAIVSNQATVASNAYKNIQSGGTSSGGGTVSTSSGSINTNW